MKARPNVRDYERLPQHSEAHLTWALIILMTLGIEATEWLGRPQWVIERTISWPTFYRELNHR